MSKTTVILVRHCEARGNIDRVFQGHFNGKITDNGKMQLSCLSERMKELPFDYLYSSPLSRAVSTAKACNFYYHLPIHIINGVIEINGGEWEGKKFASFPVEYPEHAINWVKEPWNFIAPGGESMREVYERMRDTILMLAHRHKGQRICVVSHGCAIRNFLCYAKGWPLENISQINWCDNTAVSVIEFDSAYNPSLLLENDSSHLSDEHTTLGKQSWWKKDNKDYLNFND